MADPVAKIALDTRSWGPASCEKCEADVEDVLLMSDATFVCPECLTPVEGFEDIQNLFTSATPICEKPPGGAVSGFRPRKWWRTK